jgi:gamma-polyglutamate biosynthesis protein CapC
VTGLEVSPAVATIGLAIGLILSLVCYLVSNLSPGGMITPGWLALTFAEDYRQALLVLAVTVATFGLTVLLQRFVILYGKRLFAAVVLIGVLLQTTLFLIIQQRVPLLFTHETLGFVAPGLIAYQLTRQRILNTVVATGVVTGASYALLVSGVLVNIVPTL